MSDPKTPGTADPAPPFDPILREARRLILAEIADILASLPAYTLSPQILAEVLRRWGNAPGSAKLREIFRDVVGGRT